MPLMTIAQAARAAGISPKMVRHYESLGLLAPTARNDAGYRLYAAAEVRTLRIIGRARDLGFPLPSIARMLDAAHRRSPDGIGAEIDARIAETERQLQQLARLLAALHALAAAGRCSLDPLDRDECPARLGRAGSETAAPPAGELRPLRRARRPERAAPAAWFEAWGSRLPAALRPAASADAGLAALPVA